MNVLIVGGGGREHALAWKIKQSEACKNLYAFPGNAGIVNLAKCIPGNVLDFETIKNVCLENSIDCVIVGPDDPLAAGIVDFFMKDDLLKNIKIFGPNQYAAQLESSKSFAKKFMAKYKIPTAAYREFTNENLQEGYDYIQNHCLPIVLKADGLALGKGVVICMNHEEALQEYQEMLGGKFGDASKKVVVEEFLTGIEMSSFVITDGNEFILLPSAKDYKRIGDGDTGLNTGGMGAVSPVSFEDEVLSEKILNKVIKPTIAGIKNEQMHYRGFVFFGLIIVDGEPYVIEYNARMGDPETEVIMPRINDDLLPILSACADGKLENKILNIKPESCTAVILVSGGYPGSYEKNFEVSLVDENDNSFYFHMGTKYNESCKIVTQGGRLLACIGLGDTLTDALTMSYARAQDTNYTNKYFRKDIGKDLLKFI